MGAWSDIRSGVLLGLVLFLVFSEPFVVMVRLKHPLKGGELTEFIARYGPEYGEFYGGRQPSGEAESALITAGLADIIGLMLDGRVRLVGMPFAMGS